MDVAMDGRVRDNPFVFIPILKAFRVPRENQQKVFCFGHRTASARLVSILLRRAGALLLGTIFGAWLLDCFLQIKGAATGGGDDEERERVHPGGRAPQPSHHGRLGDRMLYRHGGRTPHPSSPSRAALGSDLTFAYDLDSAIITSQAFGGLRATCSRSHGSAPLFFLVGCSRQARVPVTYLA